jgi:hypothetical protein
MKKLTTLMIALLFSVMVFAQNDQDEKSERRMQRNLGTRHSMNFDLGINNILENGKSPQESNAQYAVKPIGSWNFAINSVNNTHIGGALYLQWGGSLSWYNFKFEDAATRIIKLDDRIEFIKDDRPELNLTKSKLTSSYLNITVVPMLDFSNDKRRYRSSWHHKQDGFRIGVGAYAGYKIDSHSKAVYEIEGSKKRDKNKDNYFLNTWRYGGRLQAGYRDVDFFINYDVSELFAENKGPQLNAFSFGIII